MSKKRDYAAEKRAEHARRREAGLKRLQIWVKAGDAPLFYDLEAQSRVRAGVNPPLRHKKTDAPDEKLAAFLARFADN